jgi:hypothetical protein
VHSRTADPLFSADAPRTEVVLAHLARMRSEGCWPTGPRCLWTDAHGLVLLVSLHRILGEAWLLDEACRLAERVGRTLEQEPRAPPGSATELGLERFDPLGMWIFGLGRLAAIEPAIRPQGLRLARAAYGPGSRRGSGRLDAFLGHAACRSLDEVELSAEIADLRARIEGSYRDLVLTRDAELGSMLWLTHLHAGEAWAQLQRGRCLRVLEHLWVEPRGWFCREPGRTWETCAVANHGISIGLQAVGAMPERVESLRRSRRCGDQRREAAQVLACCAELPGELLLAPRSA